MAGKLTYLAVKTAKPQEKRYTLFYTGGLYLEVAPNGSKWWRFRYRAQGKQKVMSLGVYPDISLKNAREKSVSGTSHTLNAQTPAAASNTYHVPNTNWVRMRKIWHAQMKQSFVALTSFADTVRVAVRSLWLNFIQTFSIRRQIMPIIEPSQTKQTFSSAYSAKGLPPRKETATVKKSQTQLKDKATAKPVTVVKPEMPKEKLPDFAPRPQNWDDFPAQVSSGNMYALGMQTQSVILMKSQKI